VKYRTLKLPDGRELFHYPGRTIPEWIGFLSINKINFAKVVVPSSIQDRAL